MYDKIVDKKAAALQATLALISEQGFHATPMSQIAQQANIGVGTIYRYFPSKEALINSLYIHVKTRAARYVFETYSEDMPVKQSFIILLRTIIDYFIENPMDFLFMQQYENSPLITDETRQEGLKMFVQASNLFLRAQEQGLLKELPMDIINAIAFGATKSLANLYLFSAEKPKEEALAAGVEAIWDSIRR